MMNLIPAQQTFWEKEQLVRPEHIREYEIIEGPFIGTYGSVLIGCHNTLKTKRAFKQLHPHVRKSVIRKEALKLKQVTSPYVIQIIDFFEDEKTIVMEYCPIGLDTYLYKRFKQTGGKLPFEECRDLLQNILQGLIDAHSSGIIHGDIKPANVRFGVGKTEEEIGYPKLGDFGAARSLKEAGHTTPGSHNWVAPELLAGGRATKSSDYFSFGILAYLIFSGKHPFFANDPSCLTSEEDNIKEKTFIPENLGISRQDIPNNIAELVMGLLSRDADARESVAEQLKVALSEPLQVTKEPPRTPLDGLTIEQMELLQNAYDQAHYYFANYFAEDAVKTLDVFLSKIEWERFKETRISSLADCWSLRGYILNARRNFKDAINSASNGLSIDPDHVNSLHVRAYANTQLGNYPDARNDLKHALTLPVNPTKRKQISQLLETILDREPELK